MEEKNLGYLLKTTSHYFKQCVNKSPVFQNHPEIQQGSSFVLHYLENHKNTNVYQKDFEKYFGFTKSTITGMLNGLEDQGYIRRLKENSDGRLRRIVLTPQGLLLNEEIHQAFQEAEEAVYRLFTAEEYLGLIANLEKVKKYLEVKLND